MSHLDLILVKGVRSVSRSIFFACGCPVVPAPFVEETIFAPLNWLYSLAKVQLTLIMGVYFWALCSFSLIYLSVLSPISHSLDYSSFVLSLFYFSFLFFYFWLHWVFVAACRLSLVAVSTGFSLWWLLLLWSLGSRCMGFSSCGSQALEHRLSSCGTWASVVVARRL